MAAKMATNTLSNSTGIILLNHTSGHLPLRFLSTRTLPIRIRIRFSRRLSDFSKEGDSLDIDSRSWSRSRSSIVNGGFSVVDDIDDDDEDDEEEDRSLDLLIRFVQNMFRKISKKARKAVRSVLPVPISSQLVGFSVNGTIILTFMWVLKAFLEVICTLGSVIFVSILLVRGIWTGISYLQEHHNHQTDELEDKHRAWRGSQPAT